MTATERVVSQLHARRVRENEYRARCPVHQGKSETSLSITDAGDRVLLHCHAGCELRDILAALRMKSAAELYNSVRARPDPEAERQARIRRGLDIWCERKLGECCELLRSNDELIRLASGTLSLYEDGRMPHDAAREDHYWDVLKLAVDVRDSLESDFAVLNGRDRDAKIELWRRYR